MTQLELKKEIANSLTHGVGVVFAFIGTVILLSLAVKHGSALHVTGLSVYCGSLILLYLASTLYHSIQHGLTKRVLRIVDHVSIYLLIGGSYTPFVFIFFNKSYGWTFLAVIWALVVAASMLKIFFMNKYNVIGMIAYVGLGWLAVFLFKPMMTVMPWHILILIAGGGIFYTVGILFYAWKRYTYHHAVWHIFVLTASVLHYVALVFCVAELNV